ncbi:MAG: hypothetical protein J1F39_02215 [Clostridiales bacterium]|nr:hypothetical protein [Clostridiales bacterium]
MFVKRLAVIMLSLVLAAGVGGCSTFFSETPDIAPHLISEPDENPVRPIDGREEATLSDFTLPLSDERYRERVDELYQVVAEDGKKPVLSENDPVKPVYDAAISLLNRYMLNAWQNSETGEVSTVHSIHDYLVSEVEYDNELYESSIKGEDVGRNPAFDIDGPLLNKLSVCDGLSKTFVFLCAIEGIEAIRVTGTYMSIHHAWNKVKVNGEWYNVDVTADAANYLLDGNERRTQISHGFFLLSDYTFQSFVPRMHVFDSTVPAITDYDYFGDDEMVNIGGKLYSRVVTSQTELNAVFEAIGKSNRGVGKIELKLDFEGKINVNNADMYTNEINNAYTRVFDADFTTASQRPYFQAPNGVYLFLIYK